MTIIERPKIAPNRTLANVRFEGPVDQDTNGLLGMLVIN